MKATTKLLVRAAALLVLIFLFIARPLVRVRLCIVAFHRFGHLALEPEIFLGEQDLRVKSGVTKRFPIQVHWWSFGPQRLQANKFLVSKWREVLCVLPSWWIDALHTVGHLVPLLKLEEPKMSIRGNLNALDETETHLQLTEAEHRRGHTEMRKLDIDPDKPYVCLVVRDGGHYASLGEKESDGYSFLNFEIASFEQAALWLVEHGYQVVRMGAGSETPLSTSHPQLIDYANSQHRSEFLDIYIAATCSFAVSTQTGPDAVCLAFRRPVCYIDVSRFSQFFFGTKLAWWNPAELWQGDSRLTLRDILRGPIFWIKDPNDFIREGIRQVRSSADRIDHLVRSFVDAFENNIDRSNEINEKVQSVRNIIAREIGDRGKSEFGEINAVLNYGFAGLIDESQHFMS